MSIGNYVDRWN